MAEDEKGAKASDLVAATERLFLDLIGTVIPGALLLVGWGALFGVPTMAGAAQSVPRDVQLWVLLALAYVLGHFVTGFGSRLLQWTGRFLPFVNSDEKMSDSIARTLTYASFVQQASTQWPHLAAIPKNDIHGWRNVAMSLVTPDQNHTVYRFMFISLLNLGAGTVCILLALAWLGTTIATKFSFIQPWGSALFPNRRPLDVGVLVVGLVLSYFFFERRGAFYPRALRTPFSMAIVKLGTEQGAATPAPAPSPTKPTVYLAGGMRSHWQDTVIRELPDWNVIDPRSHHLGNEDAYTLWDLDGVQKSDWVLANIEATNPGGYNLSVEVGYAKALGKRIIYVDGKSAHDQGFHQYSGMLRACATVEPRTLDEALALLKRFPVAP